MGSQQRSASPTTALWVGYQSAAEKRARMLNMGLHIFYPEWQGFGRVFSPSFRQVTLKIYGTTEELTFPCQVCTKVEDVKQAICSALLVEMHQLIFIVKQGCSTRQLLNGDEMRSKVMVRGITSFKASAVRWEHPTAVIGAGYHGLKTCMMYLKSGNSDIVCFDRNSRVGGYCWITAANKTSRLQTEFAAFHVWWGQEMMQSSCGYPDASWETWPKKEKVLEHFQHAAEEYGVLPHIRFQCNVSKLDVDGDRTDHERFYNLAVSPLNGGAVDNVTCSVVFNYPGSMTKNRIIDYPGEEEFHGHISYGMNDDTPYDHLEGTNTAILGNGAFAVENARTCIEYGAEKVFIVTRRKNLASPRFPCWFVHQGPVPTPGRMVLDMFEPMYKLCNFGDPWHFWSVTASSDKQKVQIIQNSRFGIGDVTFLAVACGKLEFVVDTLKRCTRHTLHLAGGRKLENVTVILKALGLLGDFTVDRLHKMDSVTGFYCNGDWRRVIYLDATGMNAANFSTFSTGIGTTSFVRMNKYFFDHPKEFYRLQRMGLLEQLPKNRAKAQEEKPAYVYDVNHTNSTMVIISAMCPRCGEMGASDPSYKYKLYHTSHPLDKFLRECRESWDEYQEAWKARGCQAEYVPYPYTTQLIEGYFAEYNRATGMQVRPEGPLTNLEEAPFKLPGLGDMPTWAINEQVIEAAEQRKKEDGSRWWKEQSAVNVILPGEAPHKPGGHH